MSAEEPTQDPKDKASGAAARDQEIVDPLDEKGVTEDELPDEPTGGEAEPVGTAGERETGEERAARNRAEDPPA
jgi:hypothetical protein